MLQITVPASKATELWDDEKQEFSVRPAVKEQTLQLEHSLISLSKWESTHCKSFLKSLERNEITAEEILDYIKCMTLTPNVKSEVYDHLTEQNIEDIRAYIDAPMTATQFYNQQKKAGSKETVTSELIYYWMITWGIPFECQKWHLTRLLTLIRVCAVKNQSPKKMSKGEIMSRNAALNAARKKKLNTHG